MTATVNSTCETITITSDYFDPTNISVTLNVTINCGAEYIITADSADTEIVVDQAALGLEGGNLEDGIYYLKLTIVQENTDLVIESSCKFINCTTTCLMQDTMNAAAQKDPDAIIRALAFHALVASNSCTSCACADLCTLYTTATSNCYSNDTTNPCGCS